MGKLGMTPTEQKATVEANTNVVFEWSGLTHDVYQFADKTSYDKCEFAGAKKLAGEAVSGAYTYAAKTVGTFYFGCQVTGHCQAKQKLTLTVTAAGGTTTGAAAEGTTAAPTTKVGDGAVAVGVSAGV